MGYQSIFKNLMRINLVVTGVVSFLAFIFLLIANVAFDRALITSLMGAVIIVLLGTVNIYIVGFKSSDALEPNTNQDKLRYLLSYLVSPFIYFITWMLFQPLISEEHPQLSKASFTISLILSSWLMNTLIIFLYNYNFLQQSKLQSEIENLKLKTIVSETANQVLKQQIHPHFLFNVLNTVKSLYKKDIIQGEAYLVHLANFLRASLSNSTARIVKLEDEFQLCRDYIEMQQIRFGKALTYQNDFPPEIRDQKFVPYFAVQTLLENAIKHNDLTEEAPLNIQIIKEGDFIRIVNNLQPRHFKEPSTGQGLPNLAERYRLLAGEEIYISQNDNQFMVSIKLLNNEDSNH